MRYENMRAEMEAPRTALIVTMKMRNVGNLADWRNANKVKTLKGCGCQVLCLAKLVQLTKTIISANWKLHMRWKKGCHLFLFHRRHGGLWWDWKWPFSFVWHAKTRLIPESVLIDMQPLKWNDPAPKTCPTCKRALLKSCH